MDAETILAAHKRSGHHRSEIEASHQCRCWSCLATYPPAEIEFWCDDSATALCPNCGMDAVLGDASGYPLSDEFLTSIRQHFFPG